MVNILVAFVVLAVVSNQVSTQSTETCKNNAVFTECGSACPSVCGEDAMMCIGSCQPGCECKPGYSLHPDNSNCISGKCCRALLATREKCTRGATYQTCGGCDQKCNEEPMMCAAMCRKGCFCPHGHLRNAAGDCVPQSQC